MDSGDATEGDDDSTNVSIGPGAVSKPVPLDNYELVQRQGSEIAKEVKAFTNGDDRRRDAIMLASRRRHQKALALEQTDHWKVQYEITTTLSSAVKLTDLNRQSVDNRIAMEIVQIGPGVASNLHHAQRKAKQFKSMQQRIERDALRELLEKRDMRSFQEEQTKRRLVERTLDKQIQMSQTKASLALEQSKRLQAKVKTASLELAANYRFFNDLTQLLLERQRRIRVAFEPMRKIAEAKKQSRHLLHQLESEAVNDRRNLEQQHLNLFKIEQESENKAEQTPQLQIVPPQAEPVALDASSLFFGGLKDVTNKKPVAPVEAPPTITKKKTLTLDEELEEVEVRTVQASWGLAIIKAKLQSAKTRLDKVRVVADRVLQATKATDLEIIINFFLNADESALVLYQQLGQLRDEISELESGARTESERQMTRMDFKRKDLQQHLADVTSENEHLKSKLNDGHRDLAQICGKVSCLIDEFQLPKPMVPISDLNLLEAVGIVETYVYSVIAGGKPPSRREISPIVEEPGAERFFTSWNTPKHRRVRTYLDSQEFSLALKEEMRING